MEWNQVPGPVRQCCGRIWEAGYEAYPVGGCVRDTLLGRVPGDWDVTTSARPQRIQALFPRTVPTGLKHGTVTVLLEGMALEVTTFRREAGYSDGRRPDGVSFDVGLQEDLGRRDFTINAIALDRDGGLVDPWDGRKDLAAGLIRCVGDAGRRFREDALRMLRAVRFAAQLGFSIEAETGAALEQNAGGLDRVSGERVKAELEKILLSPRPEWAALPVKLGMLERFGAPAGQVDLGDLAAAPPTPEARWRRFCQSAGLDITALPVERRIRRFVLRPDGAELAVTGRDLYDLGLREGEIGAVRRALESHILQYPEDNTREKLLNEIKKRSSGTVFPI